MSENTKLWDILGRTDPAHVKRFKRAGGFEGTAIKPMWSFRRMTEEFGPCGKGWGVDHPVFQVVPGADGEMLVYCTANVWWKDGSTEKDGEGEYEPLHRVYGVGGDKVVGKNKYGLNSDDEAFKKAFTDAVTNALKLIGVGADVHMGLFDDSKYVNSMKEEFADNDHRADPPRKANGKPEQGWREDGTRTSFALKKEQPDLMPDLMREADECKTLISLEKLKDAYRKKAVAESWNGSFKEAAKEIFLRRESEIMDEMERLAVASPDELADVPLRDALEHSLLQSPLNAG